MGNDDKKEKINYCLERLSHCCNTHLTHHIIMPLDTSSYTLAHLRLDGRRWNELRRCHGQMSTQAAADGSSYLEMGNTKVICTVTGPTESRRSGGTGNAEAKIEVEIGLAGFSGVERKRRAKGDK
jgi:exosome complex component RRP41